MIPLLSSTFNLTVLDVCDTLLRAYPLHEFSCRTRRRRCPNLQTNVALKQIRIKMNVPTVLSMLSASKSRRF